MAPSARRDPYKGFNFRVEIDGSTVAGFSECSGLGAETNVIEYREGTDKTLTVRKLPGLTKFTPIVLKRGITTNRELWDWAKSVWNGNVQRRNGATILLADDGTEVVRWAFFEGWPSKYEGPTLNGKGNDVAIETLVIEHERLERE